MDSKLLDNELRAFRAHVDKYVQAEIVPHYEEWEAQGMVPREVWLEAGRQGWLCPEAPPELGGAGASLLYTLVVTEALYYHGVSGFFIPLHSGIVFPYLERFGDEAQKKRWVPGCVSGESILALAMSEPGAGSDLAGIRTSAVREGDHYVINGSKTFISNGQLADLFVVAVKTDPKAKPPHRGISLIVVESSAPGFKRGRNLKKIGFHAQDTSEIFFDNCRVPVTNLLGQEGQGFRQMMENLQQERLVLAVGAAAAAAGSLDLTVEYVKSRQAFGQPLSKLQNTRFELAELATRVELARTFLDSLISRHMAGEQLVKEVSMAKYWVTDTQFEVADRCLQLFGGYGYMKEYPISRYFLDARVQRIYGGANEIMKELIARELGL